MNTRHRSWRTAVAALITVSVLSVGACTPAADDSSTSRLTDEGRISHLQLGDFGGGSNPKVNYNPYSATALGPLWTMYEPLYVINTYDCTEVPWLATDYAWVGDTELHLTVREGVTWGDGEAFDADDVAFTLRMLMEHPALDRSGATTAMTDAQAASPTEVVVTFSEPSLVWTTKVLTTLVVAEHVWSEVDDPVTYLAEEPVGTGPFELGSFNPQRLTFTRNADYWQADTVKVDELRFDKADTGGQVDQLKLARGEYDANTMYLPDIETAYVAKAPEDNHYWFPAGGPISLYMNLTQAPFDDAGFRQAIAYGMDKERIVEESGSGYVTVASQTSVVVPGQSAWLDPEIPDEGVLPYDVDRASTMLTEAGYPLDSSGRRLGSDGQPMSFTLITPQGWSDWTSAATVITESLGELGIDATIETPVYETLEQDRSTGNFQLALGTRGGTCSMFTNFDEPLGSANTAPIGVRALTNEVRWEDPETDALLARLATTVDAEDQKPIVHELENIMMDEVPFITLWYGGRWFEYSTRHATGWPSAETPYAGPSDNLLVYTSLVPADS